MLRVIFSENSSVFLLDIFSEQFSTLPIKLSKKKIAFFLAFKMLVVRVTLST
jgi:hypothetical protein